MSRHLLHGIEPELVDEVVETTISGAAAVGDVTVLIHVDPIGVSGAYDATAHHRR
ncbi:MAG: hypothetical protein WBA34_10550 [Candidatus Deferrimicrobiaceae bacterium]